MKLKTERDLSYIVEFFQNNRTSSITVILLTNGRTDGRTDGRMDGQTNGRDFNTSLAQVYNMQSCKGQFPFTRFAILE